MLHLTVAWSLFDDNAIYTYFLYLLPVAVVVTSGERHEGKAGIVLFAGKTV